MTIEELLKEKSIKPKDKTETISKWLLDGSMEIDELISYAQTGKDPVKATCIEAIEFATKENPDIATESILTYVTQTLTEKAPRVKWESAKVIGNIAHKYPTNLDLAIENLIENTNHSGTVVRWAAAFALGEIIKLEEHYNKHLVPDIADIVEQEEKNSIKKIYQTALNKVKI